MAAGSKHTVVDDDDDTSPGGDRCGIREGNLVREGVWEQRGFEGLGAWELFVVTARVGNLLTPPAHSLDLISYDRSAGRSVERLG